MNGMSRPSVATSLGCRAANIVSNVRRSSSRAGVWVSITMPSLIGVMQLATGRGTPSILTRHSRQAPTGAIRSSSQRCGT